MARALVWARYVVIAFWLAAALVSVTVLPTIGEAARGGQVEGFVAPDSPTVQTEIAAAREFGFPLLSRTAIVQRNPEGLPYLVQGAAALRAANITRGRYADEVPLVRAALPVPNTLGLLPGSREAGTTVVTYLFTPPWAGFAEQAQAAEKLTALTTGPGDSVVGVTGSIPARVEQGRIIQDSLHWVELATVAAIVILVGLVFRSVVAPLVTVLVAGVSLVITVRAAPLLGQLAGVTVPTELEPLYVALVLGVVTDYVIFFLHGLRTRLGEGMSRLDAARRTTADVAPIVAIAGITVAAGTASLLAARSELFRAFGPGMALAVLIGMVVALTLTPALMAVLGRYALWPTRPKPTEAPGRGPKTSAIVLDRFFGVLTRRRSAAAVLVGCLLALGFAALPVRDIQLGLPFVASLPDDNRLKQAADAATTGFADGILSPTLVLVRSDGLGDNRPALDALGRLLDEQPGVAAVVGPGLLPATVEGQGVLLSADGDAARYLVILDSDPLGGQAVQTVSRLQERAPELLGAAGLAAARVDFGGDTALASEIVAATTRDLLRISLAALAANLLLLVLFLRALVAPVLLLASSVLALAASLGVTTYVMQELLGHDGLTFYVPFAAAVLLLSLGSDYNIFGVGQVWQQARRSSLRQAIRETMPGSTKAITAAGVTLAVSFGLLAMVPLRPFAELAFVMSLGILLDAVVVRSLLVPSMLTLLGSASSWPARLRAGS